MEGTLQQEKQESEYENPNEEQGELFMFVSPFEIKYFHTRKLSSFAYSEVS